MTKSTGRPIGLTELPTEIIVHIVLALSDIASILSFKLTCKLFYQIIQTNNTAKQLKQQVVHHYRQRFAGLLLPWQQLLEENTFSTDKLFHELNQRMLAPIAHYSFTSYDPHRPVLEVIEPPQSFRTCKTWWQNHKQNQLHPQMDDFYHEAQSHIESLDDDLNACSDENERCMKSLTALSAHQDEPSDSQLVDIHLKNHRFIEGRIASFESTLINIYFLGVCQVSNELGSILITNPNEKGFAKKISWLSVWMSLLSNPLMHESFLWKSYQQGELSHLSSEALSYQAIAKLIPVRYQHLSTDVDSIFNVTPSHCLSPMLAKHTLSNYGQHIPRQEAIDLTHALFNCNINACALFRHSIPTSNTDHLFTSAAKIVYIYARATTSNCTEDKITLNQPLLLLFKRAVATPAFKDFIKALIPSNDDHQLWLNTFIRIVDDNQLGPSIDDSSVLNIVLFFAYYQNYPPPSHYHRICTLLDSPRIFLIVNKLISDHYDAAGQFNPDKILYAATTNKTIISDILNTFACRHLNTHYPTPNQLSLKNIFYLIAISNNTRITFTQMQPLIEHLHQALETRCTAIYNGSLKNIVDTTDKRNAIDIFLYLSNSTKSAPYLQYRQFFLLERIYKSQSTYDHSTIRNAMNTFVRNVQDPKMINTQQFFDLLLTGMHQGFNIENVYLILLKYLQEKRRDFMLRECVAYLKRFLDTALKHKPPLYCFASYVTYTQDFSTCNKEKITNLQFMEQYWGPTPETQLNAQVTYLSHTAPEFPITENTKGKSNYGPVYYTLPTHYHINKDTPIGCSDRMLKRTVKHLSFDKLCKLLSYNAVFQRILKYPKALHMLFKRKHQLSTRQLLLILKACQDDLALFKEITSQEKTLHQVYAACHSSAHNANAFAEDTKLKDAFALASLNTIKMLINNAAEQWLKAHIEQITSALLAINCYTFAQLHDLLKHSNYKFMELFNSSSPTFNCLISCITKHYTKKYEKTLHEIYSQLTADNQLKLIAELPAAQPLPNFIKTTEHLANVPNSFLLTLKSKYKDPLLDAALKKILPFNQWKQDIATAFESAFIDHQGNFFSRYMSDFSVSFKVAQSSNEVRKKIAPLKTYQTVLEIVLAKVAEIHKAHFASKMGYFKNRFARDLMTHLQKPLDTLDAELRHNFETQFNLIVNGHGDERDCVLPVSDKAKNETKPSKRASCP